MKISTDDFRVLHRFPVHWGDMDSAQHVNNLVYLRWAETARVLYFRDIGINIDFGPGDTGAILAYQDCKYTFPMRYPDTALVGTRTISVAPDRFTMQTAIFSAEHQRLAALTEQVIVPYDYGTLAKAPLPSAWVERIEAIG
ncbi:acyl-CoA thioester hydrolase [Neolewinella xylanilytica]|uniref:Acyl-CoA thioester hydrolase n=1 Tax=Neolewinella xylanilytica TaxID=1514080 RepID=A0A2S6IBL9_9BACT|nr:thioesterase family protein [Neolewinella xylanilytica]PPK88907.1 acyl-CoA thioester hydrolase [Neolewinella xylanilytica]